MKRRRFSDFPSAPAQSAKASLATKPLGEARRFYPSLLDLSEAVLVLSGAVLNAVVLVIDWLFGC